VSRYSVLLTTEPEEGGYSVTVPALAGLVTQGETLDDALTNAREAIAFHLECLAAEGQEILRCPEFNRVGKLTSRYGARCR
jgi:antitoxin HicB